MTDLHVTTEHFTPRKTSVIEIEVNMERYMFALRHLADKVVIDLGTGSGLGAYLYSLVAKKVITVDYDINALDEARLWPFPKDNVEFLHADLENPDDVGKIPPGDVMVAIEVLEHLADPKMLLEKVKAPELVFSVPLHSMDMSTWHKYDIKGIEDVQALIGPLFDVSEYHTQQHKRIGGMWVHGEGVRYRN